ncbi:UNVERIFIED_CONTAM: hypothetical protein HDU68_009744 [Siphonaria sp. JEL0065]|nr:hypothetical protein HDU68_009744 [Siphonaria sp. JEL0065]
MHSEKQHEPPAKEYISSFIVVYDPSSQGTVQEIKGDGNGNINKGFGTSSFSAICLNTTTNPAIAITGFTFYREPMNPWYPWPSTNEQDLAKGAGGDYRFLRAYKEAGGRKVKDVWLWRTLDEADLPSRDGAKSKETVVETQQQMHRIASIKFVGPRTPAVWKAAQGLPAPHFGESATTAHVPKSDNFFNAPPFPPRPRQNSATENFNLNAQPQTVAPPSLQKQQTLLQITQQQIKAKGPAAPSAVLLYPSADLIPNSFRARGLSQKEIDMVDLGGIYDPPKPAKKDAKGPAKKK